MQLPEGKLPTRRRKARLREDELDGGNTLSPPVPGASKLPRPPELGERVDAQHLREEHKHRTMSTHRVTIMCSGEAGQRLKDLAEYIAETANVGHSFKVVVDPGEEAEKRFGFDGDGSDHIQSVELEEIKPKEAKCPECGAEGGYEGEQCPNCQGELPNIQCESIVGPLTVGQRVRVKAGHPELKGQRGIIVSTCGPDSDSPIVVRLDEDDQGCYEFGVDCRTEDLEPVDAGNERRNQSLELAYSIANRNRAETSPSVLSLVADSIDEWAEGEEEPSDALIEAVFTDSVLDASTTMADDDITRIADLI